MNNYKGFLVLSIALLVSAPSVYATRSQRKQAPEPCHMRLRSASAHDARNEQAALPVIRYLTEVCKALEAAEAAAKQARQEAAAARVRIAAEQRSANSSFNDAEIRRQALAYLAGERDDLGDESEQDVLRVASPTSEDATYLASWYDYTDRR